MYFVLGCPLAEISVCALDVGKGLNSCNLMAYSILIGRNDTSFYRFPLLLRLLLVPSVTMVSFCCILATVLVYGFMGCSTILRRRWPNRRSVIKIGDLDLVLLLGQTLLFGQPVVAIGLALLVS